MLLPIFIFIITITTTGIFSLPMNNKDNVPGNKALENFPLIDGHNDLPHNLRLKLENKILNFSLDKNLRSDNLFGVKSCNSCFTDLPRLKQGKVGAQFWVAYIDCKVFINNVAVKTIEQIDVIRRLIAKYPKDLQFVTDADGIIEAFKNHKIGSLIGVEGGHSIENNLAVLRQFYNLGVRYLTLTHVCDLPWADSSLVDKSGVTKNNLTSFGKKVVLEMNRLGMMVDLSHVSHNVMVEAITISKAPVIFSHSSVYSVYQHHRNVRDDVLHSLKQNQGIIMVNFYNSFIAENNATIHDVARHINYIVDLIGLDFVGIGADFDGVDSTSTGLEDVSKYTKLFDLLKELQPARWSIENLEKLAGRNFYRVFKEVEKVRDELFGKEPDETTFS